jgi:hypothetical protein
MILYIHGFGSSAFSKKSKLLKDYFGEERIFSPSLPYIPKLSVDTLEQFIKIYGDVKIIGASLGGYYATYLSSKYDLPAVIINPVIDAKKILKRAVPTGISYYDNTTHQFLPQYLEDLERFEISKPNLEKSLVLLQKGDEVLDYREAERFFKGGKIIIEEAGNHGFENFETKLKTIEEFFS